MTANTSGAVLVTGSSGLLGRAVVAELAAAHVDVLALDRVATEAPSAVRFVEDALDDRDRLEKLCVGLSGIVHCAAYAHLQSAREDILFAGNVVSTANLLLAAEAARVPRLVYASSQSALGFAYASEVIPPVRIPVDENEPAKPREGYALSKLVGEQLCEMASGRSPIVTRCLRFPVIWSDGRFAEHTQKRLKDPRQAAKSQWAYVDVRDAARACRLALTDNFADRFAVFNIAAPWPFAMDDPEQKLRDAYGSAPRCEAWRAGDAIYDSRKAAEGLVFRAEWRWTPDGVARA